MITIIDTGICNITSILMALKKIELDFNITKSKNVIYNSKALIIPGVGSFPKAMALLKESDLIEPILLHAKKNKPILGICLGMQLLAEKSFEFGQHEGLGIIPGIVKKIPKRKNIKVPNIGWCDVYVSQANKLLEKKNEDLCFYFVHSYFFECKNTSDEIGFIKLSNNKFTVACKSGNVYGVQFHPEKSQQDGLQCLENFGKIIQNDIIK